jgi:hypothetical protein
LPHDRVAFGQVVAEARASLYFALFERAYDRRTAPGARTVVNDAIAFVALSFDGKLRVGDWEIVGNEPVSVEIALPAYKRSVGSPDRFEVVDFSGQRRRAASTDEAETLPYRTVVSPAVLEDALRAHHGLAPWDELYDELRPVEPTRSSAHLFG